LSQEFLKTQIGFETISGLGQTMQTATQATQLQGKYLPNLE